jgi:ribonuclease P protein component
MALPKANRLKSRNDFQAVFREGVRRYGSYMTVRALRPKFAYHKEDAAIEIHSEISQQQTSTKIGISISTKVSKRAVIRNRIRRQISAALYQMLPNFTPGWRIVIIIQPKAAESKCVSQQILQELEQLLAQIEVFNGHS